jgi:streptogramin lyase
MKDMKALHVCSAAALAALLTACGGGGNTTASLPHVLQSTPPVSSSPSPQPTAAAMATVTFTIAVPPNVTTGSNTARRPMYVSPNTNSVAISLDAVNGKANTGSPSVAKIAYGQPGCTASASQPLSCTVSMTVPAQVYDTLTVSTFSSQDGSGTPLSKSTITQNFAANQQTNVPLSLGGVVASIAMSPSVIHTVQGSARLSYSVSVIAKDASGAVILGSAPFQSPISISVQNDPNNALSVSESAVMSPGMPVTVYYDGTKTLSQGHIVASAGSLGTASADVIPLSFTPGTVSAQMGSGTQPIAVSEAGFTGQFTATVDLPSIATANVSSTGPGAATVNIVPAALGGMAGDANVTISDGSRSATIPVKVTLPTLPGIAYYGPFSSFGPVQMTLAPSGKIYMTANPNEIAEFDTTTATLARYSLSGFGFGTSHGIAVDGSGNVWVGKNNFPTAAMCEMSVPSHAISCYSTGMSSGAQIYGVTLGSDGAIWFCDGGTPAIGRIDPVTHAITEYSSGLGASAWPYGITDGGDGNMYFSDAGSTPAFGSVNIGTGAIAEYTDGLATYDPTTQLESAPYFVVRSSDGNIWAADPGERAIDEFVVSQHRTIQHTNGIEHYGNPWAIASAPNGDLWFTDSGFFAPDALGKVNTATAFIQEYGGFPAQASGSVNGLVLTSPHDIWFFDQLAHSMGHVSI